MLSKSNLRMLLPAVLVVVTFGLLYAKTPSFLSLSNIGNVMSFTSLIAIPAMGLAIVMLTGMFDLSFVGVIGLSSVLTSFLLQNGVPVWICLVAALALCLACGLLNSYLIVNMKIHPWLTTIATMLMLLGLEKFISKGNYVPAPSPLFDAIRFGSFLDIPAALWIVFATLAVVLVVMHTTPYGGYLYAVGGNIEAAKKAGLKVKWIQYTAFLAMGGLCWVSSVLYLGQLSGYPSESAYINQLSVILAVYFGLAISRKNVVNVLGAFVGALYVGFLANGLGLMGVQSYWIKMVEGVLVIFVVLGNSILRGDIVTYE